ncbi:MAG: GEVED domain-containing protein [Bacteroidales bacterium]
MKKSLLSLFLGIVLVSATTFAQDQESPKPVVDYPVHFEITPPLTELIPTTTPPEKKHENNEDAKVREYPYYTPSGDDPVWQKSMGTLGVTDGLTRNFAGINASSLSPSDDNGDIGPNHYVQMVNAKFQIFDRDGTSLYGPVNINTLFSTLPGGTCNSGDPIVLYDEWADRWLLTQFSICGSTEYMHIAVSQTADPTGSYYIWAYSWGTSVPDYPKFGIWRDGYYMGLNCGTEDIVVFNRSSMIAGAASPAVVKFDNSWRPASGLHCVQPLDNDGTMAPSGEPGHFITINDNAWGGSDQLWIYELDVNWSFPWLSTFNRTQTLNVSSFDSNFGGTWENIPQPGTTQKIELLSQVLMYRAQYRNFGSYESIVCCHDVDVNNTDRAGIRWYELRRTTGSWYIYQQSTYSPDANHRWMGSISQNAYGEIALGYSVSSSSIYPSIRYTGRNYGDPLGTMTFAENTIWSGTESQTNGERWGDYSSMSVDPTDGKTFWYTTQYAGGSAWNWHTRIASFKFDEYCTASGGCAEYISRVEMGTIDNSSACDGYRDYSDLKTNLPLNAAVPLTVTNGVTSYPSDQCGVWVDWNRDDDFADAGEALTPISGVGPYEFLIDPPASATVGDVRVRIRITYTGAVDPCGSTTYGEVEDYTITLTTAATTNYWTGITSTDWYDATNWSLYTVPTSSVHVSIPAGTPYSPVINAGYAYCQNFYMSTGASLDQNTGSYFYCHGTFDAGFGTFTMSGTSYLYFAGDANTVWWDDYQDDTYTYVRVDKSISTASMNMQTNMTCSGTFEVREGVFSMSSGRTLTITNTSGTAFEVEDGGKVILDNATKAISTAGGVHFMDGSQADISDGTISCGGSFVNDANASYNIAFTGGTLVMNGASTQYINDLDGGALDLYNLTIAKSAGTCYIQSAILKSRMTCSLVVVLLVVIMDLHQLLYMLSILPETGPITWGLPDLMKAQEQCLSMGVIITNIALMKRSMD